MDYLVPPIDRDASYTLNFPIPWYSSTVRLPFDEFDPFNKILKDFPPKSAKNFDFQR